MDQPALEEYRERFIQQVGNDLNTSMGITALYDGMKAKVNDATKLAILDSFDQVLSLSLLDKAAQKRRELAAEAKAAQAAKAAGDAAPYAVIGEGDASDPEIEALARARGEAKRARDFQKADAIREQLKELGVLLEDIPNGVKWRRER